jgi:hypothetical protein
MDLLHYPESILISLVVGLTGFVAAYKIIDNLKHCGIVKDRTSFYHAQTSRGTNLSDFDPFWRSHVFGFRALQPARPAAPPSQ